MARSPDFSNKMATLFLLLKLFLKLIIYPFYKCLLAALTPFIKTKKRSDYSCNIVLITGAAQGIGKALASEVRENNIRQYNLY